MLCENQSVLPPAVGLVRICGSQVDAIVWFIVVGYYPGQGVEIADGRDEIAVFRFIAIASKYNRSWIKPSRFTWFVISKRTSKQLAGLRARPLEFIPNITLTRLAEFCKVLL